MSLHLINKLIQDTLAKLVNNTVFLIQEPTNGKRKFRNVRLLRIQLFWFLAENKKKYYISSFGNNDYEDEK